MKPAALAILMALGVASCGATGQRNPGKRSRPAALRTERVLSAGVLAYQIALDDERVVTSELSTEFSLVVRRAATGEETQRIRVGPSDYDTTGLALQRSLAWISVLDGTVRRIDLASGTETGRIHLGSAATAVAVDDDFLVTATDSGVLCLRRVADLALLQCTQAHSGRISALALFGDLLVSSSWSGEVTLWSMPSLKLTWKIDGRGSVNDVAISPSGSSIALARSRNPPIRTPAIERAERGANPSMSEGAIVEVISIDRSRSSEFRGHVGAVTSVVWLADGSLVSAGWDRKVALWDTSKSRLQNLHDGFGHLIHDLASPASGNRVAAAAWAIQPEEPAAVSLTVEYSQ